MNIKTAILAAIVGIATVTGANAATAAPLAAQTAVAADSLVVDAGYRKHGYRGHYDYGHQFGWGYKQRHGYGYGHAGYGKKCFKKKFKVWSDYHHGWVYKFKTVCYRGGHH